MMSILFTQKRFHEVCYNPDSLFEVYFEEAWMKDPFVAKIIKDIDNSKYMAPHLVVSPVLGPIPPIYLSGGVKALIMLNAGFPKIFDLTVFGENCESAIAELSKKKDFFVTCTGAHLKFKNLNFKFYCVNSQKEIKDYKDYINESIEYLFREESEYSKDEISSEYIFTKD